MSAPAWQRVKQVVADAMERPTSERAAFLEDACGDEPALLAEARDLLTFEASASWLDQPVPAARVTMEDGVRIGDTVGRYQIIARLGDGASAVVFEAEQDRPRRRVAIKVLRHNPKDSGQASRFTQEAQVLAGLHHPGIAQLYEAGTVGEGSAARPYFAMELVTGVPLTEYARVAKLSVEERLTLFASVCDAVEHAHQAGIVHRDLKPANILVEADGRPVVLDFGIARVTGGSVVATMHTVTGQIMGSIPYLSPEQVAGRSRDANPRSDVFALGIILHELLTGRRPHSSEDASVYATLKAIQEDDPAPLRDTDRRFDADLEVVVSTALARDPDRRYATAGALAADVRRFLAHRPIAARKPGRLYRLMLGFRRHRALSLAVAAGLAAILLGASGMVWQTIKAIQAGSLAEQRYREVLDLNTKLIFDVHHSLAGVPGTVQARRLILDRALQDLELLAAQKRNDPATLRALAAGYSRLGQVMGSPGDVGMTDFDQARGYLNNSIAIYESLVARGIYDDESWGELTFARYQVGLIATFLGRHEDAIEAIRGAMELPPGVTAPVPLAGVRATKATLDESKKVARYQILWTARVTRLPLLVENLIASSRRDEAEAAVELATTETQRVLALRYSSGERGRAVRELGYAYIKLGQSAQSLRYLQIALQELAQTARGIHPDQFWRYCAGDTHRLLGMAQRLQGDPAAAATEFRLAETAHETYLLDYPDFSASTQMLAEVKQALAECLANLGQVDDAVSKSAEAIAVAEGRVATAGNQIPQISLAVLHTKRAALLQHLAGSDALDQEDRIVKLRDALASLERAGALLTAAGCPDIEGSTEFPSRKVLAEARAGCEQELQKLEHGGR